MTQLPPRDFTVINAEQRSDEWHQARMGRLTGSRAADMLAMLKSGEAAARRNYRTQLVLERITQRLQGNDFTSQAMQTGIDREPIARNKYVELTGNPVRQTGFLRHDKYMVGCSLDGDIEDFEGIIEIKCPGAAVHLGYIKSGVVPADYMKQIIHNLWVSGADWCDFVSFHPDFPQPLQIQMVHVERHEGAIRQYEAQALAFLAEVDREQDELNSMLAGPVSVSWAAD